MKLFFSCLILFCGVFPCYGESITKIVARINDEVITTRDLEEYQNILKYHLYRDYSGEDLEDPEEFNMAALKGLIEDRLIIQAARREGLEVSSDRVDERMREMVSRFPSYSAFEQSVIQSGINISDLREKIKDQNLMLAAIERNVRSRVTVSPFKITEFYENNKDMFVAPKRYVCWVGRFNDSISADALKKDIDSLGFFTVKDRDPDRFFLLERSGEDLREEIYGLVKDVDIGTAGRVELDGSFFVVYLEDIVPPRLLPLETVKDNIYRYLTEEEFGLRLQEWVTELREQANIRIYD